MAAASSIRTQNAEQLRRAMKQHGYSLREMAIEVENVRRLRADDDLPSLQSLQRTISHILATGQIGQMWRDDLAAVFGIDPGELFSPSTETRLPHPLLVHLPVDHDVLQIIEHQQQAHISAEHLFGPQYARPLVDCDLTTVEALIAVAPHPLKSQMREAAEPSRRSPDGSPKTSGTTVPVND